MAKIDELARDFLNQSSIAVVGVSRTREDAANNNYRQLKKQGYKVYAVNPNTDIFEGDPCYPDVKSLPEPVGGVLIVTSSENTLQVVQDCVEAGIPRVWMHNMTGTSPRFGSLEGGMSSVSLEAVKICQENNIAVIPGACPMQFAGDFGHTCMRWMWRAMGSYQVPEAT